jgi:hypothetical protein
MAYSIVDENFAIEMQDIALFDLYQMVKIIVGKVGISVGRCYIVFIRI